MKKQFILFLFLLSVITVGAKTIHKVVNPVYVAMQHGTMEIASVKTTEEATTISFRYPGEGFYQFTPGIYLVDEQGKHHELIGQKGFSEDSLRNLKPKKKGKYELHFEPLSAETQIFDIIEGHYNIGGARYYGVREKNTPFAVSNPLPHNEGDSILPYMDFKVDTVLMTGRIENYNPEKCKFREVIRYTPYLAEYSKEKFRTPIAIIKEDGTFKAKTRVVGPTWCYLMLAPEGEWNGVMFIPVMLYPNDSIDLCISIDKKNNGKTVKYNSKKERDFSRLMQCAPMVHVNLSVTPYNKTDTTEYCSFTPKNVKRRFEDYDNLGLYLSGKYGLNRMETEMLRSHLSTVMAIHIVGETNSYLKNHHSPTNRNTLTQEERSMIEVKLRNSNSPYYAISFSNIRAESNVFLTIPNWTTLLSTHSMMNLPAYRKYIHDYEKNRMFSIYKQIPEYTKSGGFYMSINDISPEMEKKEKMFNEQASKLYYEWMLKPIREWRGKEGEDDTLFEQAYMLCCTRAMPYQLNSSIPYVHKQFVQCKEFFYHPSIIRMANELLYNREKECYQEIEDFMHNMK